MIPKKTLEELVAKSSVHECPKKSYGGICVKAVAAADFPTRFGTFQIVAFVNNKDGKEHVAIVKGDVCGKENVPTRLHSECLTGDALGSMRCDCRDQLTSALEAIGKLPHGLVLYLRQEGRGIGLVNKIKAYALQDMGYDTVEANHMLGFGADLREYGIAAHMLATLRVRSIELMTNNPDKIAQLEKLGVQVNKRLPHVIPPNSHNRSYLETKRVKAGHLLDKERLEQGDAPIMKPVKKPPSR